MHSHNRIQPILLAAGSSSRFGSDKLLRPLADSTPVVLAAARTLVNAVGQSLAVVRSADSAIAQHLESEPCVKRVACPDAAKGMGHSIACAVRATPNARAWLIVLGDMPFINRATIVQLARLLEQGRPIVAPNYQGRRGHPVGFSRKFRAELLALQGDVGARGLLQRHRDQVTLHACDDPGVLKDIDRPEDLHCPLNSIRALTEQTI